ncbi:ATP-binding protein [uncultured Allofournierella sp.]|uniref:ATP-binding protein n=1 Tax=uncultured Allofournierella sp. TaxID=1940258 RepID=UPI0025E44417|nr:sensor histidine kinase [uncultured Fournierella sp.]
MEAFLFTYHYIMLEFLFGLYLFYGMTLWNLHRADRFWLRLILGFACVLTLTGAASWAYLFWGQNALGRSTIYIALFAATIAHVRLCFDEPFLTILFCCSVAYAAQNLCYKLYLTVVCGAELLRFSGGSFPFDVYSVLFHHGFYVAAALVLYWLFLRRAARLAAICRLDRQMLSLSVVVLLITAILCSVEDVYFARLSTGWENQFEHTALFVLRQAGNLFSVTCCAIVLLLAWRTIEQRELAQEVEYLQHTIRQSQRQYEISRDTIERINIKCHGIKYQIASLAAQGRPLGPDAVYDLEKAISIYDTRIETHNQLLDVLLTEKSLYCEQNGIQLSCMVDGEKLAFLENSDLYCLFGNVIDNALEAVAAVPQRERRIINLVVKARGCMLLIQQDNYFDGTLTFQNGLPLTTKADTSCHGFGLRSIQMIVHKYDGELTAHVDGDVFHLNILFSLSDR